MANSADGVDITDILEQHFESGKLPAKYLAVDRMSPGDDTHPALWGFYEIESNRRLTNFTVRFTHVDTLLDGPQPERNFLGVLSILGKEVPFRISAAEFSSSGKIMKAVYNTAGPQARVYGKLSELGAAITDNCWEDDLVHRTRSSDFGWTAGCDVYVVPSGRITSEGFQAQEQDGEHRVDLSQTSTARYLDMRPLPETELDRVKRHIVADLLQLQDQPVTHSLMAATALAVLFPFLEGVNRLALWLVGNTGSGKSFIAQLFQNFFGNFPVSAGRCVTWGSTANFIQREGFFHKDALYTVDDYKAQVVGPPRDTIRVLQNYADGTGRGRLKFNASASAALPIRGMLLATGEDIPERSASAIARSVVVRLSQEAKDLERGQRCLAECGNYPGVMADFIRHLLVAQRPPVFVRRVRELQDQFCTPVNGEPNDLRVAGNVAQLAAAFEEIALYLADVWPESKQAAHRFINQDCVALRNAMLAEARNQAPGQVFLTVLGELVRDRQVRILGYDDWPVTVPIVGKVTKAGHFQISTRTALGAVEADLRRHGQPPLRIVESTLLRLLLQEGKLLGRGGHPLRFASKESTTQFVRLQGDPARCFTIGRRELLGDHDPVVHAS